MKNLKQVFGLFLSLVLVFNLVSVSFAQEDGIIAEIEQLVGENPKEDLSESDITKVKNLPEEGIFELDSEKDSGQVTEELTEVDVKPRSGFEPDIMMAAGGTKVYSDARFTSYFGEIKKRSIVYAISLSGNAVRIAFVNGKDVLEGYVSADSLKTMTKESKAIFAETAQFGTMVYSQKLLSISFTRASAQMTKVPDPTPTAKPTITSSPTVKPTGITTPAPTINSTKNPTQTDTDQETPTSGDYPTIVRQPASIKAVDGEYVFLNVKANNTSSYQWQCSKDNGANWVDLTDKTIWNGNKKATLFFVQQDAYNGYMFRCRLGNEAGYIYTNAVKYNLGGKSVSLPVIGIQPVNVSVSDGENAVFNISASGVDKYQWQYSTDGSSWMDVDRNDWSGSTSACLTLTASAKNSGYSFRCAVSNEAGTLYSNAARLNVVKLSPPVIIEQPVSSNVKMNETVVFSVKADNAASYQWEYSTTEGLWKGLTDGIWAGSKTRELSFQADNNGYVAYKFRCKVSNSAGTVYSNIVSLSIYAAATATVKATSTPTNKPVSTPNPVPTEELTLVIIGQPQSVSEMAGKTVRLTIEAENAETYQWYYRKSVNDSWKQMTDGSIWNGTRTAELSFTAGSSYDGSEFRCLVSGHNSSEYSDSAIFTLISDMPVFDTSVQTVGRGSIGSYLTLTAKVKGATSYQWELDSDIGVWTKLRDNSAYQDTKTSSLKIKLSSNNLYYRFRLKATNAYGTSYSPIYTLEEEIASPTNVRTSALSCKEISVSWTASVSSKVKYYQVFYNTSSIIDYNSYVTVTKTNIQLTNLKPDTTYYVWVQAIGDAASSSLESNVRNSVTTLPLVKPGKPTSVSAFSSSTSVSVSWEKPESSEVDGYYVYYRLSSANSSFKKISVNGADSLSVVISGLTKDKSYQIWVAAFNEIGEGGSSTAITVKTLSSEPAPEQPTKIAAVSAGSTTVRVSWKLSTSSNTVGYRVYYGTSSSVSSSNKIAGTYDSSTSSATVTNLTTGTTYYFWVVAYNLDGVESTRNDNVRANAVPKATSATNLISAETFSKMGDKYLGTSYGVYDCQAFVERMLNDAGLHGWDLAGSNAWYRTMSWRGTPEQCIATFGCVPTGAFLFILKYDGGEPGHYRDNLGNASHIGVVTHRDGGAIHSSYSRGRVCTSVFNDATIPNGGWNMVGLWTRMDYGDTVNSILESLTGR